MVLAHRNLTFGTVMPGVLTTVHPADARAGVFEIVGPVGATVRIEFALPAIMEHFSPPSQLPLSFTTASATLGFGRGAGDQFLSFTPHMPVIQSLGAEGRVWIRLGGTVTPGIPQTGGEYEATIYVTVTDLGT